MNDLDGGHDDIQPNFERVKFDKEDDGGDDEDDADTDADTAEELAVEEQPQEQRREQSLSVEEVQLKGRGESGGSKKKKRITMWMSPFRGMLLCF